MANKESNVVLNFKMDGQVEYAKTIRDINAIMNAAASEYKTHVAAMGKDADQTKKLSVEKKKLEVQLEAGKKRTEQLRAEYEQMAKSTNTTTGQLANKYKQLQNSERAEIALENALERVNEGLSEQAIESRKAEEALSGLEGEADSLESQTEKLNAEYELQKAQLGENASEADKLKLQMEHLNDTHELAKEKVENYEQQLEQAKTAYGENSTEVDKYETQLLEARTAEQQLANEIDATNKQLENQESILRKTSEGLKKAGDKMKDTGKSMSKKVTAPILGAAAAATKIGMDFQSGMSEVAAVSGATGEELEELELKAREMGATTNKSAKDAADGLKYMALAGWDNEEMLKGIEPMLKLSSAGNIDLGRASDLVTDSMSAMGIQIDQLDDYLDTMAATASNSNTDIDMLGEAFITAGGKLRDLEIDFKDGSVALGLLADSGIKGSEAGRGLSAILTNLTSPTGRAKEAIEDLGLSFFDANGDFIGVEKSLKLVDGALEGMTQEQQTMYRSMIAGKEHSKTFSALMNSLGDDFDELADHVDNADGSLEQMYDTMTDNLKGRWDEFKSAMEEAGLTIFDNLQPHLETLLGYLQKAVDWFNDLSPSMQNTILVIGAVAAAIGPLLIVIGMIASGISALLPVFSLLMGPVGLVIAAIAALVAIGIVLWKNWDTIKEKAIEIFTAIAEFFVETFQWIKDIFQKSLDWIDEKTGGKFKSITDAIRKYMQMGLDNIKAIWDFVKNTFKNATDFLKALVTGDFQGMKDAIKNQMDNILSTIKRIWDNVMGFFKGIDLKQIGKDIIQGLIDGISSMVKAVGNAIKKVTDSITGKVKSILGIKSPSTVMREIGEWITQGLGLGIEDEADFAINKSENVARAITGSMQDVDLPNVEIGTVVRQPDNFRGQPSLETGFAMSALNNIGSNIKESLNGLSGNIAVQVFLDTDQLNSQLAPGMSIQLNQMNKLNARSNGVIIL